MRAKSTARLPQGGTLSARFWAKVHKTGGCWLWQGVVNKAGYGQVWISDKGPLYFVLAHRLAWHLVVGPVDDGVHVLHHCDNPPCVRPEHLFLGTQADNTRDMHAKGRAHHINPVPGERNGSAKLTAADVVAIRAAYATGTVTTFELGRQYNVHPTNITVITRRKSWRHILP